MPSSLSGCPGTWHAAAGLWLGQTCIPSHMVFPFFINRVCGSGAGGGGECRRPTDPE